MAARSAVPSSTCHGTRLQTPPRGVPTSDRSRASPHLTYPGPGQDIGHHSHTVGLALSLHSLHIRALRRFRVHRAPTQELRVRASSLSQAAVWR